MGIKPGGTRAEPLRPLLVEVDLDRRVVTRSLPWRIDPAHQAGPDMDQECTAAAWADDDLVLQPTHTELLWVSVSRWEVVHSATHPRLHSVHSAAPRAAGGAWLTSAGTDSVLALDRSGALLDTIELGSWSSRFDEAEPRACGHDAFKPHEVHPNRAFELDGDLWVTSFEDRSCRCLADGRAVAFPEGFPHDGVLRGGLLWFTLVQGHVVAVDPVTLERRVQIDLNALVDTRRMLGWCRGIDVVGGRALVGMTMLRRARHREVLRWLARGEAGRKLPTRLLVVDLDGPRIVDEIELGNRAGGTIYGVLAR